MDARRRTRRSSRARRRTARASRPRRTAAGPRWAARRGSGCATPRPRPPLRRCGTARRTCAITGSAIFDADSAPANNRGAAVASLCGGDGVAARPRPRRRGRRRSSRRRRTRARPDVRDAAAARAVLVVLDDGRGVPRGHVLEGLDLVADLVALARAEAPPLGDRFKFLDLSLEGPVVEEHLLAFVGGGLQRARDAAPRRLEMLPAPAGVRRSDPDSKRRVPPTLRRESYAARSASVPNGDRFAFRCSSAMSRATYLRR